MSRTGDALQMLLGLGLLMVGAGIGFTWLGVATVILGVLVGARGVGRAVIRARETRDL